MKNTALQFTFDTIQGMYLAWVNDFLTLDSFAEFYGINTELASKVIDLGRYIHNNGTELYAPVEDDQPHEIEQLEVVDDPEGTHTTWRPSCDFGCDTGGYD